MIKLIIFFDNNGIYTHYSGYLDVYGGYYVSILNVPVRLYNIPNENSGKPRVYGCCRLHV